MVIIKLQGGLGNQLFQYSLGRSLAIKHKTELALDRRWFDSIHDRYFELDHFNIDASQARIGEIQKLTNFSAKVKNLFKPHKKRTIITEKSFDFDPRALQTGPNVYMDGYWQSQKYFHRIARVIREEITVKTDPSELNQTLLKQIQQTESISLHVRRGDYVTNQDTHNFHGTCSLEYYEQAVALVVKKVPKPHFFIFSDDSAWTEQNLKLNYPVTYIAHNQMRAHEDLRLMTHCKYFIIANSTFSWWGAWLSGDKGKIVVAPKVWFNDRKVDTSDLIPEEWIQL